MKLTTKVAITGTVLVMLAGVGVWVTHRGEEKPALKTSNMKVEEQMRTSVPKKVSVNKPTPKEEDEQYSEQEIEEALEWLDSLEEDIQPSEEKKEDIPSAYMEDGSAENTEDKSSDKEDKSSDEIETKVATLYQKIVEKANEYRSLRKESKAINKAFKEGMPYTEEIGRRDDQIRQRMYNLENEIMENVGWYYHYTRDETIFSYVSDILQIEVYSEPNREFALREIPVRYLR